MGMSFAYGTTDDAENLGVLHRYLELGGNFLDTAEIYGPHTNELLLGRFLREVPRERVVVATKFGFRFTDNILDRRLTGAIQKVSDLEASDWRRTNPRFSEDAIQQNLSLTEAVKELAAKKGCTPAQFALAWVLAQGYDMVPIPGTKRVRYLEDNMGALGVHLTQDDLKETEARFKDIAVVGERYAPEMMALLQHK